MTTWESLTEEQRISFMKECGGCENCFFWNDNPLPFNRCCYRFINPHDKEPYQLYDYGCKHIKPKDGRIVFAFSNT